MLGFVRVLGFSVLWGWLFGFGLLGCESFRVEARTVGTWLRKIRARIPSTMPEE